MFAPSTVYSYGHHGSGTDEDDGSSLPHNTLSTDVIDGQCMVCGDRSAGKHYGVMACYGCKGFFRRTIRSAQTYTCRFQQKCSIDKDQRNACRYCRFQRCLNVGMEPEAIRPDRDVIGKQKNPRKKKAKSEQETSLPSPGCESPVSNNEDVILTFLLDVEEQASCGNHSIAGMNGVAGMIKNDPDFDAATLFHSVFVRNQESFTINYAVGRTASVEKLIAALRRYVLSAVHWIDALFNMAHLTDVPEKVALLKSVIGPFTVFNIAARTAQISDGDVICLCNKSTIPRMPARHLLDTNLVGNNFVGRVIDDLVIPTKKLTLTNQEITILSALIVLDPDARGLTQETSIALSGIRDRVQNALFNLIRDTSSNMQSVTSRFGNLLLLFPPLAKLSSLIGENVQLAKMFGIPIDSLLLELYVDIESPELYPNPNAARDKSDVSTQTATSSAPEASTSCDPKLEEQNEESTSRSSEEQQATVNLAVDLLNLLPNFDISAPNAYNPFYNFGLGAHEQHQFTPHSAPPIGATATNPFLAAATVGAHGAHPFFDQNTPNTAAVVQHQPFRFV